MDKLKSILVIVDPGARAHPCMFKAERIAAGFHARLRLIICDAQRFASASNFFDAETCLRMQAPLIMPHRELLETLAGPLRAKGLVVDTDVILQAPLHTALLTEILRFEPDLVVKDTHYHPAIRRALFTPTDWHLIRRCPATLMLVKPREWPDNLVRIAAAVDPGHPHDKPWMLDHEIIGAMEYLATGLRAECHVVNSFCTIDEGLAQTAAGGLESAGIGSQAIDAARTLQQKALEDLLAGHRIAAGHTHFVDGAPVDSLSKFVREQRIDILALGAIARGYFAGLLIGGTAERVLDRLECDVLIVKPERLSAQLREVKFATNV